MVATTLCQPQVPSATPSMGANRAEEPPARGQPGSAMRLCQNQETGPCTSNDAQSAGAMLGAGNLVATTPCQSRVPSAAPSKEQTPSHGWRAEIHLASAKCRRVTRARTHNSLNSRGLSGTYKRLSTAANSSASEPIIPQIEEPAGLWVQFPLAGIWRKKKRRRRLNA